MASFRVLVADEMSAEGVAILKRGRGIEVDVKVGLKPAELKALIGEYHALAVRSATKVTEEILGAGKNLKVVGRAGVGVDNVDLPAATKRGIVVMNTPGGSSVTVAELALSMMLGLARHLPAATASMKQGKWEKKKFQGHELSGKTLGVVGIGNIGRVVVDRALGMKMRVLAYDPFIGAEAAKKMGVELANLDELLARSDFVSVHVPLNEQTKNLIDARALAKMKKGAYLVNCARGGLVDELAVAEALKSGQLAGAALDVFAQEPPPADHPLFKLDNFVCTPHLGASTEEAQENVAVALAEQLVAYLVHGTIQNAVNVPSVSKELLEVLGPSLGLAERLGSFAGQLATGPIESVDVDYCGEINQYPTKPLTAQILRGLLTRFMDVPVNEVNAPVLAQERGIALAENQRQQSLDYATLIRVTVRGKDHELSVEGTIFGRRDPRIVRVNRFELEAVPEGHLVVVQNRDVPGVVGKLGMAFGEAGINIGRIHLSRAGGEALSLMNIDSPPPSMVLEALRKIPGVLSVKHVTL